MKKMILAVFTVLFLGSCKHEPPTLSPVNNPVISGNTNTGNNGGGSNNGGNVNNCDPNTIYFNQDILPFLISNCTNNTNGNGCHDAASHQDGIILTSYDNVMNTAGVVPYNLNGGNLYEVITTLNGRDRMPPPPALPLAQDQINKIQTWIMQGAQNLTCTNSVCDSINVSFAGKILPLINNKCKGCHSGNAPGGNILLTDYNSVSAVVTSGQLMGSIIHAAGFQPMPKNSPMLSSCEIGTLSNWIAEGGHNN